MDPKNNERSIGPINNTHIDETEKPSFQWPDGKERKHFPIDDYIEQVAELLKENQVVIVEADTGAGKTTRLPQGLSLLMGEKVRITQPRRNALRWNSKFVSEEMGCEIGDEVGYKLAREEPKFSNITKILFQIDQSLCNEIVHNDGELPEGIIIVDEAHERSISLDLLLAILKKKLPDSPNTKVIVASATINAEKFKTFFTDSASISIPGRMFPVKTREPYRLGKNEHHSQGAVAAAKGVISEFIDSGISVPTADNQDMQQMHSGTILVYLPGKEDINIAVDSLQKFAVEQGIEDRIEVLSCHGETPPKEQDQVQRPVQDGKLRIVCGTEILRTGITCPQVIGSIDSMQVKRLVSEKGVGHLKKVPISKALSKQGAGRGGRTNPGFYQPISFQNEFEHLEPYPKPAILVEPIPSLVLQISALGESIRTLDLLDKPSEEEISYAIKRLQNIGALDENEEITDIGEKLLKFPLSPERGRSLLEAAEHGVLPEAVIANAIIEQEGIFDRHKIPENTSVKRIPINNELAKALQTYYNYRSDNDWIEEDGGTYFINFSKQSFSRDSDRGSVITQLARKAWANNDNSDFTALVNAYREYKTIEGELRELGRQGEMSRNKQEERLRVWASVLGINYRRLQFAEDTIVEILDELESAELITNKKDWLKEYYRKMEESFSDSELNLIKSLIVGAIDGIAVRDSRGNLISRQTKDDSFSLASESAAIGSGSELFLTANLRKITTKRGRILTIAFLAAPITLELAREVAPNMITYDNKSFYYDPEVDKVLVERIINFNNLEAGKDKILLNNKELATQQLSEWLANVTIQSYDGYTPSSSSINPELVRIIIHNKEVFKRNTKLNHRAGGRVFEPGYYDYSDTQPYKDLRLWYQERLNNAASIAEINDINTLALPQTDPDLERKVLTENPETIEIGSREFKIDYTYGVSLEFKSVVKGDWQSLPDEGLRLPNNREVTVTLIIDGNDIGRSTDLGKLKTLAKEYEDRSAWTKSQEILREMSQPEIIIDENVINVPEIVTEKYGTSMVDGSDLIAYGCYRQGYNAQSQEALIFQWHKTLNEAQEMHKNTQNYLTERLERDELVRVMSEIYELRNRLQSIDHTSQSTTTAEEINLHNYNFSVSANLAAQKEWLQKAIELEEQFKLEQQKRKENEKLRPLSENSIKELLSTCPICGEGVQEFNTSFFSEPTQYHTCDYSSPGIKEVQRLLDNGSESTDLYIQKRYAKVIAEIFIDDNVAGKIVAFFKYGQNNIYYIPYNFIPSDSKPVLKSRLKTVNFTAQNAHNENNKDEKDTGFTVQDLMNKFNRKK